MSEDLIKTIRALEHKVHVLEEENAQLAEKAEDSLLLGLVSENIQNLAKEAEVFENTLERISILKAIPYATCGELTDGRLKPITSYTAFSDQKNVGYPITVKQDIIRELDYGPVIINTAGGFDCHFEKSTFIPTVVALIPFKTQTFANGVFIFMDNAAEGDRLSPMLMLLSQVVDMATAKYDNLFLLKALTGANKDLESRVQQRTRDLARANKTLEQEIAERKASERALRESHQTFLTVLNSIDATIYVADLDTYRILFMNQFMIDAFGRDLTGEICFEVFREENMPCPVCTNNQLLDEDGNPTGVIVWQGENPVTGKWYVNYDRAINWIDGRLVRLQIATDITQIKKMESQLQQSHKVEAIGSLAGGIAHDFNNILSAIIGYTELALSGAEKESALYQHLQEVFRAGERARELVKQILTFSRQAEQERRPVQVSNICKEVIKFLRASLPTTIEIRQEITGDSLVMADPTQIHQLLMNLCTNAGHAMGANGGVLKVKLIDVNFGEDVTAKHPELKPGPYLELTISDTGHGIPAHILDRIFDPFFTTKEKGEGTGMGLSVVHGIVGSYGGEIAAASQPGRGATFKIYLPRVDWDAAPLPIAGESITTGTERILFVDDETALVNVGKQMLESLGYKITARTSSVEALELFKARADSFDLVITDMTMPNLTGDELAKELIRIRPGIPIILCTGYSNRINQQQAAAMGIRAFVSKPVLRKDIAETIRKVLDE